MLDSTPNVPKAPTVDADRIRAALANLQTWDALSSIEAPLGQLPFDPHDREEEIVAEYRFDEEREVRR